jgi:hypothetical protein
MSIEERSILEAALRSTAAAIDVPPTPAIATAMRPRLAAPPPRARRRLMPALAVAGACLVAFLAVLTFSPAAREAVADFFGIGGIRIVFGEPDGPPLDFDIELGEQVSADAAQVLVDFPVRTLQDPDLGAPDGYFHSTPPPGGAITTVYEASRDLPEVGNSGIGLLLTQFRGSPDQDYFKKLFHLEEPIEFVTVEGEDGVWIGNVHELQYFDRDGELQVENARLSSPALIWESGGVTYRLESNLTRDEAITYANSIS